MVYIYIYIYIEHSNEISINASAGKATILWKMPRKKSIGKNTPIVQSQF